MKDEASHHWQVIDNGEIIVSTDPESMWNGAARYFKWCDEHPITIKKTIVSGKEAGKKVEVEQPRPYNIRSLCLHLGVAEEYVRDIILGKDKGSMYYIIMSKIVDLIAIQNYELGLVGVYNPILVGKALGIDKPEEATKSIRVEIVPGQPALSASEGEVLAKMSSDK